MHATCPPHLILLDLINLTILSEVYNYEAPQYINFFIFLKLTYPLYTLLPKILKSCSSFKARDQAQNPYKTKVTMTVLYT